MYNIFKKFSRKEKRDNEYEKILKELADDYDHTMTKSWGAQGITEWGLQIPKYPNPFRRRMSE